MTTVLAATRNQRCLIIYTCIVKLELNETLPGNMVVLNALIHEVKNTLTALNSIVTYLNAKTFTPNYRCCNEVREAKAAANV